MQAMRSEEPDLAGPHANFPIPKRRPGCFTLSAPHGHLGEKAHVVGDSAHALRPHLWAAGAPSGRSCDTASTETSRDGISRGHARAPGSSLRHAWSPRRLGAWPRPQGRLVVECEFQIGTPSSGRCSRVSRMRARPVPKVTGRRFAVPRSAGTGARLTLAGASRAGSEPAASDRVHPGS
jgi:hypothetical protein